MLSNIRETVASSITSCPLFIRCQKVHGHVVIEEICYRDFPDTSEEAASDANSILLVAISPRRCSYRPASCSCLPDLISLLSPSTRSRCAARATQHASSKARQLVANETSTCHGVSQRLTSLSTLERSFQAHGQISLLREQRLLAALTTVGP